MKNKVIAIIIGAVVILGALGIAAYKVSTMSTKNANGWESSEIDINKVSWGTEVEESVDYHVENVDKDTFKDMDSHSYIEKVTPVLNAYKDKIWTLFLFDDGTGILYPGSDSTETATYGKFDDKYSLTEQYGLITIAGSTVSYQDVPNSMSNESLEFLKKLPDNYNNDDEYVSLGDDISYVSVSDYSGNIPEDKTAAAQEICDLVLSEKDTKELHISVNGSYFKWTKDTGMVSAADAGDGFIVDDTAALNDDED